MLRYVSAGREHLKPMRRLFAGALVTACLSLLGCELFPAESTFELARESRLPEWFRLSPGRIRSEVTVTMSYYADGTATFTLRGPEKEKLAEVSGTTKSLYPIELRNPPAESPQGYPAYEIITVKGVTEVIEHRRMEPIFYVTDDPAVLAELGVSRAK
jgi:hypothetical protein